MSERQESKGRFWDLDTVLPKQPPVSQPSGRDTETVEIEFSVPRADTVYTPVPIPERSGYRSDLDAAERVVKDSFSDTRDSADRRTAGAKSASRQGVAGNWRTPGDVRPQMAEPVLTYQPEDSLLRSVSVYRWPSRFHYYDRFLSDAKRLFPQKGSPCPFANFFAYMPQYSEMSREQQNWYLYWRENLRNQTYLTTDYSYIFLFVFEVINLTGEGGLIRPEEGLELLCNVWTAYRNPFPRLDRYMGEWLCDYCLIYQLKPPLSALSRFLSKLIDKLTFKEFYLSYNRNAVCPFTRDLCDILSNYNWRTSKYLTSETRHLFDRYFYDAVLSTIRAAWTADSSFEEEFGLTEVVQTRNAFSGALCTHNCKRRIDIRYLSLSRSYQLRFVMTALYKMAENGIRAYLGIKSRLYASGVPEALKVRMQTYFAENLPSLASRNQAKREELSRLRREARERNEEEIRSRSQETEKGPNDWYYEPVSEALSPSEAVQLEESSWINAQLLVPEEPKADSVPLSKEDDTVSESQAVPDGDDPYRNFVSHLPDSCYQALKLIICGERDSYLDLCKTSLLLPDAMAEKINDIAVTYTDDTAIVPDGDFWHLSDYYANDIMNAVIEREDS
ncbi:MAG: TerB N-terminal domain-containing protein [Clostridia bacterium]|nr:TerB N-terminal domain-containing protein [Clostridia bacterium]